MSTFEEESRKTASEKINLVTLESVKEARIFALVSGSIYKRSVEFFVSGVIENGTNLTQVYSEASLVAGSFYYKIETKELFVRTTGSVNPKQVNDLNIRYRHFFSNKPLILPWDLSTGQEVEWLPLVNSIGSLGQQLDDEATGIVLESNSSITLINQGFFDSLYDTMIWENKSAVFYAWFEGLGLGEIKKIFDGVIDSKDYTPGTVSFKVKDFVFKLRDQIIHENFSSLDGVIADSIIGSPKRRIYGQVKQVKTVGCDLVKDGFPGVGTITIDTSLANLSGTASGTYLANDISGTVSGTIGTRVITGTGTNFTSALAINDKIRVTNGLAVYTYTVESIASATSLTVSSNITISFTSFTAKNSSRGNSKVYGIGTSFLSQLQQGSSIRFKNGLTEYNYKIEYVDSDVELTLTNFITISFSNFTIINTEVKRNVVTGTGTQFLSDLSNGDLIKINVNGVQVTGKVDSISSDTLLTLADEILEPVNSLSYIVNPEVHYWRNNRKWHIAGHKLREPITTIANVKSNNRFILNDTTDIFAGDRLIVNGDFVVVRRIIGLELVTQTAVSPIPTEGDIVTKLPVQNVYFGFQEMIYERDWTYTNSTESYIEFNEDAEFNVTNEKILGVSLQFTSGSRSLVTSGIVDFRSALKVRDRIRKNTNISGENDYYEIADVKEQEIILRSPYTGSTEVQTAYIKNITFIDDDSLITVNCLGMEKDGVWIKTASDAVKDIVVNDAGFTSIDSASFDKAIADCDYTLSLITPVKIGDKPEKARDVLTKINESVFGALFINSDNLISYSILNSDKTSIPEMVSDDDIISFNADSVGAYYNKISLNYKPFTDQSSGEDAFSNILFESSFVDNYLKLKNTLEKTVYLYDDSKALIIAQRLALFNSLSKTKIVLRGKMNFFLKSVGSLLTLKLDRLFARFGQGDKRRISIVTGVKRSQYDTELTLSDLGNVFNRVPSIAENTTPNYASASDDEKLLYGFIVDNETRTPENSSETGLGNNLIG